MPSLPRDYSQLVGNLCWNHATFSLGEGLAEKILKRYRPRPGRRVILVLGAGASSALHHLMTGRQATQKAESELRLDTESVSGCPMGGRKAIYDAQIGELCRGAGLREEDFETRFLAMSMLDRAGTLAVIRKLYGARYRPSLGYELLAHMFNHRFFEAAINFTFDELFDEALCGEMRDRDYVRVVSGDDCRFARSWTASGRLARPVLSKPHGTVSREETLRFTHTDYDHLPKDLHQLLRDLISTEQPIALWVVGFSMNSPEFTELLQEKAKQDPRWAKASRVYLTLLEEDRFTHGARGLGIPCRFLPSGDGQDLGDLLLSA